MKYRILRLIEKILRWRGYHVVEYDNHRVLQGEKLPGWFSKARCGKLYELTLMTNGPILEIGHFLGRSTACISEALRDSNKSREFVSYDLGFTSSEEFKKFYESVHKTDIEVPPMYEEFVYSKGTTTTEVASANLKRLGLDRYVKLIAGNFIDLDHDKYDFIFCDALHDANEIRHNLSHVVQRSNRNCVWAFDDIGKENISLILSMSESIFIERVESLAVFLYKGR